MQRDRTGKRLFIDLDNRKTRIEEIPPNDLEKWIGGRGLNATFFSENIPSPILPFMPENPIAFAVGPLTGTFAPCAGWTSISTFSPVPLPERYAHISMPGHWGPQLKYAGFDQLIVRGRAERPIYLWIDGEKVIFEEAGHLWGKDTLQTTVSIQEEKEDRNAEILCIGPAGERIVFYANVVNRLSWTGDHIGLGSVFGSKNLKAIGIRGHQPVSLDNPDHFLQLCRTLRERISRNRDAMRLKEEATFYGLGRPGRGLGIKNFNETSSPEIEREWLDAYLKNHFHGKEGCFSCPIHCGRITEWNGTYFGGVHLEGAWSLGPRVGISDWESTFDLLRLCQMQGIDPSSAGSLLAWITNCCEESVFSEKEVGSHPCHWGNDESLIRMMEGIIQGSENGPIFRQGSLRAAKILGKGEDHVAHVRGWDFPVRDPRSSKDYALRLSLYPGEWDYLRSLPSSQEDGEAETAARVNASEELKVLADITSFCPLVVAHLQAITPLDMAELISAKAGISFGPATLMAAVQNTIRSEKALSDKMNRGEEARVSSLLRVQEKTA